MSFASIDINSEHPPDNPKQEVRAILRDLDIYEKVVSKLKSKQYPQGDGPSFGRDERRIFRFGVRIANKIDEFIKSGKMEKAERIWCEETYESIRELCKVTGIGPIRAAELVDSGIKNVDDLFCHTEKLTLQQLIGLEYFDDFCLRIPMKEASEIGEKIKNELNHLGPQFIMTFCGSFRRGKRTCEDIDCLITRPDLATLDANLLKMIINRLKGCHLIVDTFCLGDDKFTGVCRLSPDRAARKLSIRLVGPHHYNCCLFHLTGPRVYVEKCVRRAQERGLSFDEFSIRRVGPSGIPGPPLPITSEHAIFELLELTYVPPEMRK